MFTELHAQNAQLASRVAQLEHSKPKSLSAPPSPLTSMWDEAVPPPRRSSVADFSVLPTKPSEGNGASEVLGHAPPPESGKAVLIVGLNAAACKGITAAAATELRRRFIDLDEVAAAAGGENAQADAVRRAASGELGGGAAEGALLLVSAGVLQTAAGREAVAAWAISVHVEHHVDDLVTAHQQAVAHGHSCLGSAQLAAGQTVTQLQRELWDNLQDNTKFTFTVCKGQAAPDNAETARDLLFFLRFICGVPNRERGFIGPDTFFLSLTFANVREYMALPDSARHELIRGVDVVELRVDLLGQYAPAGHLFAASSSTES